MFVHPFFCRKETRFAHEKYEIKGIKCLHQGQILVPWVCFVYFFHISFVFSKVRRKLFNPFVAVCDPVFWWKNGTKNARKEESLLVFLEKRSRRVKNVDFLLIESIHLQGGTRNIYWTSSKFKYFKLLLSESFLTLFKQVLMPAGIFWPCLN